MRKHFHPNGMFAGWTELNPQSALALSIREAFDAQKAILVDLR